MALMNFDDHAPSLRSFRDIAQKHLLAIDEKSFYLYVPPDSGQ